MVLKCITLFCLTIFISLCHSSIRLKINGSKIMDPITDSEVHLHGFNWMLHDVESVDTPQYRQLAPNANLVRMIGILWDDSLHSSDCMTNNASQAYIKPSCIQQMDNAIKIATSNNSINNKNQDNIWVIITMRGQYAAGGHWPQYPDVFHNDTLKNMFYTMWQYLAKHYSTFDYILSYEIMSEPRTKSVNQTVVRNMYNSACNKIHSIDPNTACMIGPAPYYKSWMLNETLLIDDINTIYTVDFFFPENYIDSNATDNYTYPGTYPCWWVFPGWTCSSTRNSQPCFCPGNRNEMITVNKTMMTNLLKQYPLMLRAKANIPILVNQWSIDRTVPLSHGAYIYVQDILDIFNEQYIHSTYWIWKEETSNTDWEGSAVVDYVKNNGPILINYQQIAIMNNSWSS
eukprot:544866_1